jgi:uncharacterized protein (TIGR02246 family)
MTTIPANINETTYTEDEAAIRAAVRQLMDGWNAGDGQAFAAPFADDADYTVWDGMYIKGRQTIAAGHQHIFDTVYKGTTNQIEVEEVRFLREDVALARARACLYTPEGEVAGTAFGNGVKPLFVLTKTNGHWQIDAFQNTPVVPTPGEPDEQS